MQLTPRQAWAYGAGDLGVALLYVGINTYFFYYLVNVVELTAVHAGLVFVVGRVVDAFTDPLIGAVSDARRARHGRLSLLRWAVAPTALAFVGLFALPLLPGAPVAWATLGAIGFSVAHTCVLMPYLAVLPELVRDYDDRTRVIGIKSVFTMVATLIAFAAPPALVLALDGGGGGGGGTDLAATTPGAWVAMSVVLALVFCVPMAITGFGVPDTGGARAPDSGPLDSTDAVDLRATARGLWREVRSAWQTRGLAGVVYLFLAVTVGIMITNSLLAFFLESALGLPGDALPGILGGLVLVSILAFPLWIRLSAKLGKRVSLIGALAVEAASLLLLVTVVPAGGVSAALIGVVVLNGVAVGGVTMFPWAMLPDVVELDELAVGRRREGVLYALFTFAQKLATSVGVFANAIVIAAFGYVPGVAEQSADTVAALRAMMGPGAAAVFALAALLTWRYPVTRALHAEASGALRAKKIPQP